MLTDTGNGGILYSVSGSERRIVVGIAGTLARRWTVEEYQRAADGGIFGHEERLELIDGEIICMSPQNPPHVAASYLSEEAIRGAFSSSYCVRVQKPLAVTSDSAPEPDIAVVRGTAREFLASHPTTAVLVVEVADSSLSFDRDVKGPIYAGAGIPDYWIVNLPERVLEVHRDPDPQQRCYRSVSLLTDGESAAPLAVPAAQIAVRDLLP